MFSVGGRIKVLSKKTKEGFLKSPCQKASIIRLGVLKMARFSYTRKYCSKRFAKKGREEDLFNFSRGGGDLFLRFGAEFSVFSSLTCFSSDQRFQSKFQSSKGSSNI